MTDRISDERLAELMTLVAPDVTYTRLLRVEHDEIFGALRELQERRKGDARMFKASHTLNNAIVLRDHFTACDKTIGDSHPCTCGMDAYAKLLRELDQQTRDAP